MSGDSGFNSSENDVARYTGFGGGDFVIHVQERSPLPHDMNVQVTLDADSLVNYSLEVEGPGTCRDPEGRGGVRSEGMGFGGGRRGAFALSGVSLTWPDKTLHDDRAEIHVHVRYVGGESPYSDGSFSLSVRSTDYRVSIDDPNKDGDMAQPSLACTP